MKRERCRQGRVPDIPGGLSRMPNPLPLRGAFAGPVRRPSGTDFRSLLSLSLMISFSCTEYTYTSVTQTDIFQQVRRNTVDILLVVDNSGSMAEEQDKLASNFDSFIQFFDGIDVDWRIGVITTDTWQEDHRGRLRGGEDELELFCGEGISIDRVAWDMDWPITEGAALQLDPSVTSATGNDSMSAWCEASQIYGQTDRGSPGSPNPPCGKAAASLHGHKAFDTSDTGLALPGPDTGIPTGETGEPAAPSPVAGEVLITEFMADPADTDDALGEWVELTSVADVALDLGGCVLQDDGRNGYVFPDGEILEAGAQMLLARTDQAGIEPDLLAGDQLTLNNAVLILTPDVEGASEIFAEMVAVGTSGSGLEMGLEAAHMALSEPTLSDYNQNFLREDASLSIIVLSDEDDFSPYSTDDYTRFFTDLKGEEAYRDHGLMNISGVVGATEPEITGEPSCSSDHGDAAYGSRYVKVVERTEGLLESICEEDFSPIATQLGLTVSGLDVEFQLSERCDENSLVVSLYETPDDDGFVRQLEKDLDYSFVVESNSLRFQEDQVPPSETYVVAEYQVLASTSSAGSLQ